MTNRFGLPQPIVDAVKIDNHRTLGDISITQLIDAPQVRILKKQNRIEPDASELIFALLGTATHSILERANMPLVRERAYDMTTETLEQEGFDDLAANLKAVKPQIFHKSEDENYLYEITISQEINGMTISGTFDLYDKKLKKLIDYKVCSVWNYVFPEAKKKWYAQLNAYAYMLRAEGYEVESASVIAIFRDWSAGKVITNKDYPPQMAMDLDIPLFAATKIGEYLHERVRLHREAEQGNVIECTGTEMWSSSDSFAVMQKGGKRAIKVLANESDANKFKDDVKHKYTDVWVEKRPGERKRCSDYCSVNQFCPQFRNYLNNQPKKEE